MATVQDSRPRSAGKFVNYTVVELSNFVVDVTWKTSGAM